MPKYNPDMSKGDLQEVGGENAPRVLTPEQRELRREILRALEDLYYSHRILCPAPILDLDLEKMPDWILEDPEVRDAAEMGMIGCSSKDWIDHAVKIQKAFSLSKEIVEEATKAGMIRRLSNGDIDAALEIQEVFGVKISNQKLIDAEPKIEKLIAEIGEVIPEFLEQVSRSFELLVSIFPFKNNPEVLIGALSEHPFLVEAVMNNPRFGSKLLVKFNEFDAHSKENIVFLFDTKKKILAEHPDTDPESVEFRRLMQEHLAGWLDNKKTAEAIESRGVDLQTWLNYDKEENFILGSTAETAKFSEIVAVPIDRVKETIGDYVARLKEVLGEDERRQILGKHQMPLENAAEIIEQRDRMRAELETAKSAGNERKAQGINKGLEGMEKKLRSIKTVSLWNKLMGDIDAFRQLQNGIQEAQDKYIVAEKALAEVSSGKIRGAQVIKLKQEMAVVKESVRTRFRLLEDRVDEFQNGLEAMLVPAFGAHTPAVLQEIKTGLEEQFSHFATDRNTLHNLFSEKSEADKAKLSGHPMSVAVWNRNPDIDLYQANYSPCCISIESGCGSDDGKSTIADYITDLGVQIISIYDRATGEPVTAAWCWLGKDKNNNTALVVDNVESNTSYSTKYQTQMEKELFAYLKKYAEAVGVNKLVLGKSHNDLLIGTDFTSLPNDGRKYDKIGCNRKDGYYLEANDEKVSLLWESNKSK
jgi:hypothetical protein